MNPIYGAPDDAGRIIQALKERTQAIRDATAAKALGREQRSAVSFASAYVDDLFPKPAAKAQGSKANGSKVGSEKYALLVQMLGQKLADQVWDSATDATKVLEETVRYKADSTPPPPMQPIDLLTHEIDRFVSEATSVQNDASLTAGARREALTRCATTLVSRLGAIDFNTKSLPERATDSDPHAGPYAADFLATQHPTVAPTKTKDGSTGRESAATPYVRDVKQLHG